MRTPETTPEALTNDEIAGLAIRMQTGDREAMEQLFEYFAGTLYSIALGRLRNSDDAQELVQEVFSHAVRKCHQLRDPSCIAGWLRVMTVRHSINHLVRKRTLLNIDAEGLDSAVASRDGEPDRQAIAHERAFIVRAALEEMKKDDREILTLFYMRSFTMDEIQTLLSIPMGTVKRRLHVARVRLAEILADREEILRV